MTGQLYAMICVHEMYAMIAIGRADFFATIVLLHRPCNIINFSLSLIVVHLNKLAVIDSWIQIATGAKENLVKTFLIKCMKIVCSSSAKYA